MKKDIIEQKFYIDEEGYQQILSSITRDMEEIRKIDRSRSEVHKKGTDEAWDNIEFLDLERTRQVIKNRIQQNRNFLNNATVIKRQESNEMIELGDVVKINLFFSEEDKEEIWIKLVGTTNHDLNHDYQETSINSPVGSAIYRRKIGEKVSCQINNSLCFIEILEKLNLEVEKQSPKKRGLSPKENHD